MVKYIYYNLYIKYYVSIFIKFWYDNKKIYKLTNTNIFMTMKPKTIIVTLSTIIVFILFVVLATYSHRLITTIFDGALNSIGIINPLIQGLIIVLSAIFILIFVFHRNILSFFKK